MLQIAIATSNADLEAVSDWLMDVGYSASTVHIEDKQQLVEILLTNELYHKYVTQSCSSCQHSAQA